MSPVCAGCGAYIETANVRFPGFCSPTCRDQARADRDARIRGREQRLRGADK